MNSKDLELVNKTLSNIGDEVLKSLEILQDEKSTNKQARRDAEKILDELLCHIPVFMEVRE